MKVKKVSFYRLVLSLLLPLLHLTYGSTIKLGWMTGMYELGDQGLMYFTVNLTDFLEEKVEKVFVIKTFSFKEDNPPGYQYTPELYLSKVTLRILIELD